MKKLALIAFTSLVWNLGLIAQEENLEVEGAIQIGNTQNPTSQPGTIRWTGSDFEGWNGLMWVSLTGNVKVGTVSDIDGNTYQTITVGTQEWMAENLRVTTYNNWVTIDQITNNQNWENTNVAAWCWYDNDSSFEVPYGKIYNGHAIVSGNLCPIGWHIPTDEEWTILIDYLDPGFVDPAAQGTQATVAGGKMKETGNAHWNNPNGGATNESGWSAVAGGTRSINGVFYGLGSSGQWGSSTVPGSSPTSIYNRVIYAINAEIFRVFGSKNFGNSVRCIKD